MATGIFLVICKCLCCISAEKKTCYGVIVACSNMRVVPDYQLVSYIEEIKT